MVKVSPENKHSRRQPEWEGGNLQAQQGELLLAASADQEPRAESSSPCGRRSRRGQPCVCKLGGVKSIRGLEAFVTHQKVRGHHTESIDQVHVRRAKHLLPCANLRPDSH